MLNQWLVILILMSKNSLSVKPKVMELAVFLLLIWTVFFGVGCFP